MKALTATALVSTFNIGRAIFWTVLPSVSKLKINEEPQRKILLTLYRDIIALAFCIMDFARDIMNL